MTSKPTTEQEGAEEGLVTLEKLDEFDRTVTRGALRLGGLSMHDMVATIRYLVRVLETSPKPTDNDVDFWSNWYYFDRADALKRLKGK